jgi:hypothetical protein
MDYFGEGGWACHCNALRVVVCWPRVQCPRARQCPLVFTVARSAPLSKCISFFTATRERCTRRRVTVAHRTRAFAPTVTPLAGAAGSARLGRFCKQHRLCIRTSVESLAARRGSGRVGGSGGERWKTGRGRLRRRRRRRCWRGCWRSQLGASPEATSRANTSPTVWEGLGGTGAGRGKPDGARGARASRMNPPPSTSANPPHPRARTAPFRPTAMPRRVEAARQFQGELPQRLESSRDARGRTSEGRGYTRTSPSARLPCRWSTGAPGAWRRARR